MPGLLDGASDLKEHHAEKFRREAAECRRKALDATPSADRQAWLRLAEDWSKLAQGMELSREWQMVRALNSW
jgi:hypothetical protein